MLAVGHFEVLCPMKLQEHSLSWKLRTERLQVAFYPIFFNSNIAVTIPWSRKFLEKLTVVQQVKKIPHIYTKLRFLTVFTVLEISSCTEPAESNIHSHTWLSQPIPKSKIDGTIHYSGFPIYLILLVNNKTPSFNSCILVSLRYL
jgi:hypothetical protein